MLIARGLAEAVRQADPAEHQGDRRRHVEGPVGSDRRHVRRGPAARRRGHHDRRQRHHRARTASARRRGDWARRCGGCGPAAPSSSSAPARTSASSPRSRSRCAGWPAPAGCGWPARRPPRCARRAACRCRSPTCWRPSSGRRPKCCSPTTCSTRRRPATRWPPSSCCPRCVMRWASSSSERRCRRCRWNRGRPTSARCCRGSAASAGCGGARPGCPRRSSVPAG